MEKHKAGMINIRSISQLNEILQGNKDKANILTPFSQTSFEDDSFAPGFAPSLRSITLDPRMDDKNKSISGDVYPPMEAHGNLALTKQALDKIAMMAGINWKSVERKDDAQDPFKCRYAATGEILTLDGVPYTYSAEYSLDLNNGSPQAAAIKKDGMLAAQRKNLAMITESKAKNRVIRALLGISASYRPEELTKPFMILRVIPDMHDPEVARMVKAKMLGLESYLFPAPDPQVQAPGILPAGTSGLELPEPPGGGPKQIGDGTGMPIDVTHEHIYLEDEISNRAKRIREIEALYYTKTKSGARDPGKTPLSELTDYELEEIQKTLLTKPDVRKAAEDLV